MKVLGKFVAAFLITALSITGAGKINETLISAQESAVKVYKKKRTERLSFKDVEEAKSYVFEKGNKIESIAKDLGIEYVMSDDKGLFYGYLEGMNPISWSTRLSEYGGEYYTNSKSELNECLELNAYVDFTKKESIKESKEVEFLYRYVKEVENKDITYEELIDNIQETVKTVVENDSDRYVRLQLSDGLYAAFPSESEMQVKINTVYSTRIIKEANQDIRNYFLKVKNSKEAEDKVKAVYKSYCQPKEIDDYDLDYFYFYEVPEEYLKIDFDWLSGCKEFKLDTDLGVSTFRYDEDLYPDLSDKDKIYSISFDMRVGEDFDEYEFDEESVDPVECQKQAYKNASVVYDFVNDIYNGKYPLQKNEFVSRYVKHELGYRLRINGDRWQMAPGVLLESYDNVIDFYIPLSFTK